MEVLNGEDTVKNKKTKIQEEFLKFLTTHNVYETIPENMKVINTF